MKKTFFKSLLIVIISFLLFSSTFILTVAGENDTFIDIFRHPEEYLGGIVVITMTILLIYFILRRRK